jgi:outer membrane protein TolC
MVVQKRLILNIKHLTSSTEYLKKGIFNCFPVLLIILFLFPLLLPGTGLCNEYNQPAYTIYLESYRSKELMKKQQGLLENKGVKTYYKTISSPGKGEWYRIFTGRFPDQKSAKTYGLSLQNKGIINRFALDKIAPEKNLKNGIEPQKAKNTSKAVTIITKQKTLPSTLDNQNIKTIIPETRKDQIKIKLFDFVISVLDNNLNLENSKLTEKISGYNYEVAKAVYDPVFFSETSHQNSEDNKNSYSSQFGISKQFKTGTEFSLSTSDQSGDEQSYSKQEAGNNKTYPDAHDGNISISLSQQLLKNGWFGDADSPLKLAKVQTKVTKNATLSETNNTIYNAIIAFLDLQDAYEKFEIAKKDQDFSEGLLKLADQKVNAGIISGLEKLRTEADFLQKKEKLLLLHQDINERQSSARQLLNMNNLFHIIPVPEELALSIPDFSQALQSVYDSSSELNTLILQEKSARIQLKTASLAKLPSLQLNGQYNYSLHGDLPLSSKYDSADDWSVSVSLSYPLWNRSAKNSFKATRETLRLAQIAIEKKKQALREQLTTSYEQHQLKTIISSSLKARLTVATRRVKIEREKYFQGVSRFLELQESQKEMISIERQHKESRIELFKIKLQIYKTIGNIAEHIIK